MMKDIDLNLLIVFDAVMAERNLRRAGDRLHRSQPAVSQAVARLRAITGDQLFVRIATGVAPTSRAEVLWGEVREPLERLRRALAPVQFDPRELVGEIVFGLSDDVRILLWPSLARRLSEAATQSTLRAIDTNHASVWSDIGQRGLDMALTVAGQPPAGFAARILHRDDFVLLHRADAAPATTPEEYGAKRHLAIAFGEEQPAYADEALGAVGLGRRVVARVSRFDALPALVRELDAVVALPRMIATHFARDAGLACSALPVPFPPAILKLCWHEKRRYEAKHEWLRQLTVQAVSTRIEALLAEASTGKMRS